VQGDVSGLTEF